LKAILDKLIVKSTSLEMTGILRA